MQIHCSQNSEGHKHKHVYCLIGRWCTECYKNLFQDGQGRASQVLLEQDLEGRAEALQVEKGPMITLFKKTTENSSQCKVKIDIV